MLHPRFDRFRSPWPATGAPRAFHVAESARVRFGIEADWVTLRGDVILAHPERAVQVAARVTAAGGIPLDPADLYAGALLEELYHLVIARYLATVDASAFVRAEARGRAALGGKFEPTLRAFLRRYPPADLSAGDPLERVVDGISGRQVALEELLTCHLANINPALLGAKPLVDLEPLAEAFPVAELVAALDGHFAAAPGFAFGGDGGGTLVDDAGAEQSAHDRDGARGDAAAGGRGHRAAPASEGETLSLLDLLQAPMREHPHDLRAQLAFVRQRWGFLGSDFTALVEGVIVAVADVAERTIERTHGPAPAPSAADVRAGLSAAAVEEERFSADDDWMPRVVMIAKSTHVWLDQIARRTGEAVFRLDAIPDSEFAELAARGVNALWLIGLWERSAASRTIKRLRGSSDALASAYALDDYAIATELGGEAAYDALVARAARHGIRIATDMVPNHVGIDGKWVIDHPERFVQLPEPPYPSYRFTGPDLSPDPRVEIRIEDHYYDGSDAAVVFERRDVATGEVRYLYHGNDGTAMPWNDTAQLDFLRPDVREAVMEAILAVARRSPIIRFDAAMTLAKRHVRRLWYPEPGEAGGVPSRGRWGAMPQEAFDAAMPEEFWREVVDRVAREAPGTLLLAEAFWMMEGYFVRTLGMHRVYNSAFMHMLRDHDDAGYRGILKEILRFDPRILQRFVNFMNNPDEETAREQFGDGDRYVAVTTLLATLPGLPLFGHGQFEGYREKYGMEFRRARLAEVPDAALLARHERAIVPLLRRRREFAEVDGFRLFDLLDEDGAVVEPVYAFANRVGDATSLVVVNHQGAAVRGALRRSAPQVAEPLGLLVQDDVAAALGLRGGPGVVVTARDLPSGKTLVRRADAIVRDGWTVALGPFEVRVWVDVREVHDHDGALSALAGEAGVEVESLPDALDDLRAAPVHAALARLVVASDRDAAWAAFAAALPGAPRPLPPAPSVLGDDAASVAALWVAAFTPWPGGAELWREVRARSALERALARGGVGDARAWAEMAEALLAVWPEGAWGALGTLTLPEGVGSVEGAFGVHEHAGVRYFRAEAGERFVALLAALVRARGDAASAEAWRKVMTNRFAVSGDVWDRVVGEVDAPVTPVSTADSVPSVSPGPPASLAASVPPATSVPSAPVVKARLRRPPPKRRRGRS